MSRGIRRRVLKGHMHKCISGAASSVYYANPVIH